MLILVACELRDTAESNRDFAFYNIYLSVFIPALVTILGEEKNIAFGKDSFDHVSGFLKPFNAKLNLLSDSDTPCYLSCTDCPTPIHSKRTREQLWIS
jgi:hypothetical protein